MLTDQEEQAEKRRVLLQDADVRRRQQEQAQRERSGTFFSHAQAAANDTGGGRFAALGNPTVVGASEATRYPAAAAAHQTELPPEPSLGFSIDEMPGLESSMATLCSSSVEATGDPAAAPSSDDGSPATPSGGSMSERAGSSSFHRDDDQ
jgi:hypothetical protein